MPEDERKNRVLNFRVRRTEEQRIRAKAAADGQSLAGWLRSVALRAAGLRSPPRDRSED